MYSRAFKTVLSSVDSNLFASIFVCGGVGCVCGKCVEGVCGGVWGVWVWNEGCVGV